MAGVVGQFSSLPISKLLLDKDNPRFQSGKKLETQIELANKLIMAYDVFQIAKNIAKNGYFAPSPMVVVQSDEDSNLFVVVEGNRRLSALKALCDDTFRSQLYDAATWQDLATESTFNPETEIPVVIVEKSEVELLLGYRHISGDLPWQPLAQARWVAKVIDELNYSFEAAANTSGKSKADIISMYRNQALASQAVDLGFPSEKIENNFSNITLAMASPGLRGFISAPANNDVVIGAPPIPVAAESKLKEMLTWLYGDEDKELEPVVPESRQISKLGLVIQNPQGLEAIRKSWDLPTAESVIKEKGLDPLIGLKNRISAAKNAASLALNDLPNFLDNQDVLSLVDELDLVVREMQDLVSKPSES